MENLRVVHADFGPVGVSKGCTPCAFTAQFGESGQEVSVSGTYDPEQTKSTLDGTIVSQITVDSGPHAGKYDVILFNRNRWTYGIYGNAKTS